MGIFDKVKSLKNAVTGGAAKVFVEVDEAELSRPIQVRVRAVANANFSINRVYLQLRAHEEAVVRDIDIHRDGSVIREDVSGSVETVHMELDVSGAQDLVEGQEYLWEAEIELDDNDYNPSFYGQTIRHIWEIQASLDARGNDPDSGWVEFSLW